MYIGQTTVDCDSGAICGKVGVRGGAVCQVNQSFRIPILLYNEFISNLQLYKSHLVGTVASIVSSLSVVLPLVRARAGASGSEEIVELPLFPSGTSLAQSGGRIGDGSEGSLEVRAFSEL